MGLVQPRDSEEGGVGHTDTPLLQGHAEVTDPLRKRSWAGPYSSCSLHRQRLAKVGETGLSSGLTPFACASVDLGQDLNLDFLKVGVIPFLKPVKSRVGATVFFFLPQLELHIHLQAQTQLEGSMLY